VTAQGRHHTDPVHGLLYVPWLARGGVFVVTPAVVIGVTLAALLLAAFTPAAPPPLRDTRAALVNTTRSEPGVIAVQMANSAVAEPGQTISYLVKVTNTNEARARAEFVVDLDHLLDDAMLGKSIFSTVGTARVEGRSFIWQAELAAGESAFVTYGAVLDTPDRGDHWAITQVHGTDNCPDEGRDPACVTNVPVSGYEVLRQSVTPSQGVKPGERVTLTVWITNTGRVGYIDSAPVPVLDDLSGLLDDATYNNDAKVTAGEVSFVAPHLVWSGPLGVEKTVSLTYSVTVTSKPGGDGRLIAILNGGDNCHQGSNERACTGPAVPVRR
jgi:hypothetical protein